jgi:hypothetical protein
MVMTGESRITELGNISHDDDRGLEQRVKELVQDI